jgi:hypothetical protein
VLFGLGHNIVNGFTYSRDGVSSREDLMKIFQPLCRFVVDEGKPLRLRELKN